MATSTSLTAEMNNLLSWEAGQRGAAFTPHLDNHMHHSETRTGQGPFPRAIMPEASMQQQNILLHHKSLGNINKQLHLLASLPPKSRPPPIAAGMQHPEVPTLPTASCPGQTGTEFHPGHSPNTTHHSPTGPLQGSTSPRPSTIRIPFEFQ